MNEALILGVVANLFFIFGGFFKAPKHSMVFAMCGNISYILYYLAIDLTSPMINVALGTIFGLIHHVQRELRQWHCWEPL